MTQPNFNAINPNKFQAKGLYLRYKKGPYAAPTQDPDPGPRPGGERKPTASIRTAQQAPAHNGDRGHRGIMPPLPG